MWPETRPGPGQHQQLIRLWSTSNGFVAQPGRNTQPLKGGTKLQPSRVPDDHFESGGDSALGPPTERWLPQSRRKISHGQYPTSNHGRGGGFSYISRLTFTFRSSGAVRTIRDLRQPRRLELVHDAATSPVIAESDRSQIHELGRGHLQRPGPPRPAPTIKSDAAYAHRAGRPWRAADSQGARQRPSI